MDAVRCAQPIPAQQTEMRSPPGASAAASTAACTGSGSITFTSMKAAFSPSSEASASPFSAFRSAITTEAPRSCSARTVAAPRPEAPPATSALAPSIFIAGGSLLAGSGRGLQPQASMLAITDAETVPPGIAITVRRADTWPAPFVPTWTTIEQLAAAESGAMQPLAAMEKSIPVWVRAETGTPLGDPPTLVTVKVRSSPPICGTPKS